MRPGLLVPCSLLLACATAGPPEQAGPAAGPAAPPGFAPPAEAEPGCVARSLYLPFKMWASGRVVAVVAVKHDGSVESVAVAGEKPPVEVAEAVEKAVRSCAFVPGKDPAGKGTAMSLTLPVVFDDAIPVFDEPAPATPPRQASENCVGRRLRQGLGMLTRGTTKALVVLRVSESGEPGELAFKPEDLDASIRLKITEAVTTCIWIPAADAQGRPVAARTMMAFRF